MNGDEYKEMVKASGRISRQALTILRNLQLPNIPPCYHVAYEFCEDSNGPLKNKVNALKGSPSEVLCDIQHIYFDLIASPHELELLKFSQRFHQLAKTTTASVKDGENQLKEYAAYLNEVKPFLTDASGEKVLDVTTLIIKETEAVHQHAKELEKKLNEAANKIEILKNEHSRYREQANRDPLTNVFNRAGLEEAFDNIKMVENYFPVAVLLADIDHFKLFNDEYGHLVGDSVLKVVSNALRKNIKGVDIICRFGGEEFLILLLNTNKENAFIVAENLRELIGKLRIKRRNSDDFLKTTTISIGVSELNKDDPLMEAVDQADQALFIAKNKGRNCIVGK